MAFMGIFYAGAGAGQAAVMVGDASKAKAGRMAWRMAWRWLSLGVCPENRWLNDDLRGTPTIFGVYVGIQPTGNIEMDNRIHGVFVVPYSLEPS